MRWFNKDKMSFWTRVKLCWYVFTKGSLPAKLKEYRSRPYVKARYHKYYKDKLIRDNENDKLNAKNTERLVDV